MTLLRTLLLLALVACSAAGAERRELAMERFAGFLNVKQLPYAG